MNQFLETREKILRKIFFYTFSLKSDSNIRRKKIEIRHTCAKTNFYPTTHESSDVTQATPQTRVRRGTVYNCTFFALDNIQLVIFQMNPVSQNRFIRKKTGSFVNFGITSYSWKKLFYGLDLIQILRYVGLEWKKEIPDWL